MIEITLTLIVLGFLIVATLIDTFAKSLPSAILTTAIFIVAIVNIAGIPFGIIAGLFGLLLYDLSYFKGVADIKALGIIGLMCNSFRSLMIMMVLVMVLGTFYKVLVKYSMKKQDSDNIPFLLPIFVTYVGLWAGGFLL